jgi:hypothetical protein
MHIKCRDQHETVVGFVLSVFKYIKLMYLYLSYLKY